MGTAVLLSFGLLLVGCDNPGGGGDTTGGNDNYDSNNGGDNTGGNNNNGGGDNAGNNNNSGTTAVTFSSVTANGSSSQTTTQLTLTFSQAITGLSSGDVGLSGVANVTKGTLSGSGPSYTLPVSGFTGGGTLAVSVSKTGYTISGSPKTVTVYYSGGGGGNDNSGGGDNPGNSGATAVTFSSLSADGSSSQTTTQLTLTFSQAVTGLSSGDISLSGISGGVTKGTLNGSGPTYTLPISGFTDGGTLTVSVSKTGYTMSGSPKQVTVYYSKKSILDTPVFSISNSKKSGNDLIFNWSLQTSGSSPNGQYAYTAPASIKVSVWSGSGWDDIGTPLAGTAKSYTLKNYSAFAYSPQGVSGNRVSLRITCTKDGFDSKVANLTYYVESNAFAP